jgi:hypothetical protein
MQFDPSFSARSNATSNFSGRCWDDRLDDFAEWLATIYILMTKPVSRLHATLDRFYMTLYCALVLSVVLMSGTSTFASDAETNAPYKANVDVRLLVSVVPGQTNIFGPDSCPGLGIVVTNSTEVTNVFVVSLFPLDDFTFDVVSPSGTNVHLYYERRPLIGEHRHGWVTPHGSYELLPVDFCSLCDVSETGRYQVTVKLKLEQVNGHPVGTTEAVSSPVFVDVSRIPTNQSRVSPHYFYRSH